MTIRKFALALAGALSLLSAAGITMPTAEARELRVSTFEPPQAFLARQLAKWIEIVGPKLSDGTSLRLFPGALLGAPPAQQELVRKGVADIAFVVTGYTPGVFPRTSVANLPFIAQTSKVGTTVVHTLLEEGALGNEYDDFKVIGLFTTNGYSIFSKKDVNVPDDIAGLKLRTHDALASQILGLMGANGVGLPAPQTYEAIERGVVDGAVFNFTAAKDFRVPEVTTNATYIPITNTVLAVLMNRAAYEGLSEADRKVIDEYSGSWFADWIATLNDEDELAKRKEMADGGLKVNILEPAQFGPWQQATAKAEEIWLKSLADQKIDGKPILDRAHAIAAGTK
jgi:TRAP-type C4-dicarboxylate transport system substrate-binding protein